MARTLIYLIRHGATEANLARPAILQGRRADNPLSMIGVRQAEATRDLLRGRTFHACYSSPMARAVDTARTVAAPHGLEPTAVSLLTECDVGVWEGRTWGDVERNDPEAFAAFRNWPHPYLGGETFLDTLKRAVEAIDTIIERHPDQAVLVVSHHIVLRTLLAKCLGVPTELSRTVSLDNCGVSVLEAVGDELPRVRVLNECCHLPAESLSWPA